jgi:hypothetical protein
MLGIKELKEKIEINKTAVECLNKTIGYDRKGKLQRAFSIKY